MALVAERLALVAQNQRNIENVNKVAADVTSKILKQAARLDQNGVGGYLRTTLPGVVDEFGNLNAKLAVDYYDEVRFVARQAIIDSPFLISRADTAAARAAKYLQGQAYVAKIPNFNPVALAESVINSGMTGFMAEGQAGLESYTIQSLTRAVASYNRDTVLYNSTLDRAVLGVQRVASPTACDFCQMVAFDSSGNERVSSYAANYHKNCACSIETIYAGGSAIRPEWYNDFDYGNKVENSYDQSAWNIWKSQAASYFAR